MHRMCHRELAELAPTAQRRHSQFRLEELRLREGLPGRSETETQS